MITGNSESLLIEMVEGDWGEELPLEIETESEITASDKFVIEIFKDIRSREPIITKNYENIQENTINFRLTQEDSEKLKVGTYFYNIDWYKENSFLSNVVRSKMFKVIDKAGR